MAYLLSNLGFMAIDCQATGAHPQKGDLVELGWAAQLPTPQTCQFPSVSVTTCLIQPKIVSELSQPFRRVTGIATEYLQDALSPAVAWHALHQAAGHIMAAQRQAKCLAVIHFARYEVPFLDDLHHRYSGDLSFPFDIICTHEICRRALPELPRRGLRAVAGFFGYTVPPLRRSALHATATVAIWRHLVALLRDAYGVRTLKQLRHWLTSGPLTPARQRFFPMPPAIRKNIPDQPGVYQMLRQDNSVLYIGKSHSLKQRIGQYFQKKARHAEHILEMLTQAGNILTIPTRTAVEAALLETDLIKRHGPPYNIALQQRHRRLFYMAHDLKSISRKLDAGHPCGPLPDKPVAEALTQIRHMTDTWLRGSRFDCKYPPARCMALPVSNAPDADTFLKGAVLFFKRHGDRLKPPGISRCLLGLGQQLWRERARDLKRDEAQDETDTPATDETQPADVWTADRVADALESILVRGVHLMRRARWLALISEATVVWEAAPACGVSNIGIILCRGQIDEQICVADGAPVPVPPTYDINFFKRRQKIHISDYDRLRILTTELRRLISQGRRVQLRLSPTRLFTNPALTKILQLV